MTNIDQGGEGVKNPENLADVICAWPLRRKRYFTRIRVSEPGISKMHIFNMSQLQHTPPKAYGHQFPCYIPLKKPFYVGFQEAKGFLDWSKDGQVGP